MSSFPFAYRSLNIERKIGYIANNSISVFAEFYLTVKSQELKEPSGLHQQMNHEPGPMHFIVPPPTGLVSFFMPTLPHDSRHTKLQAKVCQLSKTPQQRRRDVAAQASMEKFIIQHVSPYGARSYFLCLPDGSAGTVWCQASTMNRYSEHKLPCETRHRRSIL